MGRQSAPFMRIARAVVLAWCFQIAWFHMGVKYPPTGLALAAIAPAAFGTDPKSITTVPNMPVIIVHGDMDTAVPVSVGRSWAETLKGASMTHE